MSDLVSYLAEVGKKGFRVDEKAFMEEEQVFIKAAVDCMEKVNSMAGRVVEINSPTDVAKLVFEERGNECKLFSGGHKPSASIKSLLLLSDPIVPLLVEWKKVLGNLKYFKIARKFIVNGRLSYEFEPDKAANFKVYAKNPNIMSFPAPLRRCILPSEGNIFIYADYNREEMAVVAWAAGEIKFFEDAKLGFDILSDTANVVSVDREKVKTTIYAFFYGAEVSSISRQVRLSDEKVGQILGVLNIRYPRMVAYIERLRSEVKTNLKATTLLYSKDYLVSSVDLEKNIRIGVNFTISGTCALILRDVVEKFSQQSLFEFKLCTHDSVLVECPVDMADVVKGVVEKIMTSFFDGNVLAVKMRTGKTWFEAWDNGSMEGDGGDEDI